MARSKSLPAALVLTVLVVLLALWRLRDGSSAPFNAAAPESVSASSPSTAPTFTATAEPMPSETSEASTERHSADTLDWTFQGVVLDESRRPLERFGVRATRLGTLSEVLEQLELPLADHEKGVFEFSNLTPGHWRIAPFAPERRLVLERNFWEQETKRHDYLLLPLSYFKDDLKPARLQGVVLLPSGRPARAARVAVYTSAIDPDRSLVSPPAWTTNANAEGRFLLAVAPGQRWLTASLPEFDDAYPVALELTEGESRDEIRLQLTVARRARFWFAAADPARPRPLALKWFEIHGDHEGSVAAEEGGEFEVPLAGTGAYRWELVCENDPLHSGLFESPRSEPAPTLRLERRAPTPVVVHYPTGCFEEGVAIAADRSMGALPLVRSRKGRDSTEFELPCGGRWTFAFGTSVLHQTAFTATHDIPAVARFEVPCPNALRDWLQVQGY